MSDPLKLEDLDPMPGQFVLKATGNTYTIRPITLGDQKYLKSMFGSEDAIKQMFEGLDPEKLTRLVYYLMDQEGRRDFLPQEKEMVDEEGNVSTVKMNGPETLMHSIQYPQEFTQVFQALLKTIGISNAMLDNIEVEEVKKKEKPSKT